MSKLITVIVLVIAGLGVMWYFNTKIPIVQESPTPTVSATPADQSVSTPEVTFTYGSNFGLATTKAQILVSAYIPPCSDAFDYCLYYNGSAYKGTNFESAGLRVARRTDLGTKAKCLNAQPEGYSDLREVSTDGNGYSTSVFSPLGDAGAGHYANGALYRLWFNSTCYEFETRIGETQFANYPADTIKEFSDADRNTVQAMLNTLINNITITATGAQPFSL